MHDVLLLVSHVVVAAEEQASASGLKPEHYRLIIEGLLLLLGTAAAFGGLRLSTKNNKEAIETLVKKVETSLAAMGKKIDDDLTRHENNDKAELNKRDTIISMLTQQNTQQETTIARMSEAHSALGSKHDLLAGEIRNRASALEARVATTEQSHVELRADMRALTATVSRIDANVEHVRNALAKPTQRRAK